MLNITQKLPHALLNWYDKNARPLPWRADRLPYHVWLSEIMLQQTGVETVIGYYRRFLEEVPSIEVLAETDEQRLLKLWEGLGYYSRALNLKKTAGLIVREHGGRFPDTYDQLIKLPGIGPYTAGAIASICFEEKVPAVDGNVVRVISRVAGIYESISPSVLKKTIAESLTLIYPQKRRGDFTQSLMELGATVCLPRGNPKCGICPIEDLCKANKDNMIAHCPPKQERKAKKQQDISVFILICDRLLAVRRRKKEGLLGGMWEFPNIAEKLDSSQAMELAAQWNTKPASIIKSDDKIHLFTHIQWNMTCYSIVCHAKPNAFTWLSLSSLTESFALPTAFRMFLTA
ncbi:MAG: A/G-specific adenine glycosylase [Clostridiales bacterium]|nr:A/G-specific adenine glycosylase [Clostridiales bacterium]